MKNTLINLATLFGFGLGLASIGQAVTPEDARALRDQVYHAKSVVDRAIGSGGGASPGNSNPGPGPSPWELNDAEITENDFVALPIYQQSAHNLFTAGSYADKAIIALSGVNVQEGAFLFAQSCAKMGISRSQIARANLAASQPPVGYLAAFGPELTEVVIELNELHQRCF